jgi:hypothetical protein
MQLDLPLPPVLAAMERLGYAVFKGVDNVNIWGIRAGTNNPLDLPAIDDKWNDLIGVSWQDKDGYWHERVYPGTTDPGVKYIKHPINSDGTAVLVPGQYRGAYKLGLHKGRPALVQRGRTPVTVWRLDKDGLREKETWANQVHPEQASWAYLTGWFGLNIHDGVGAGDLIGPWSAGCQVIPGDHITDILEVCERSAKVYGASFTYTLLTEGQFNGTWPPNTTPNRED